MLRRHITRTRLGLVVAVAAGVLLGTVLGQPGPSRAATSATKPVNTTPPTITGTAEVAQKLTATRGTWTGKPTSFRYAWSRCDADGACLTIAGATGKSYIVTGSDIGHTLRVTVFAKNAAGETAATSGPTVVIPPSGCPVGTGVLPVAQLAPPARLVIAGASVSPALTAKTKKIHLHIKITACGGRPVQGAIAYAAAIPFNQFAPVQATTAADGTVVLTEGRRAGFPASQHQRLLAVFVRSTKPGDSALDGVSSRRVLAFRFAHH
jgi:hypothetical protein